MLRDTTSRGLYVRVWPPHTSVPSARGTCVDPRIFGVNRGSVTFLDPGIH